MVLPKLRFFEPNHHQTFSKNLLFLVKTDDFDNDNVPLHHRKANFTMEFFTK